MHKITDQCSVESHFSIPVAGEVCSNAGDCWHKDADASAAWELIHGLKSTIKHSRGRVRIAEQT